MPGFDKSSEYGAGLNFYPANSRNHRLNLQYLDVNGSPVSSTFGYYVGGHDWEHVLGGVLGVFLIVIYPHPQGDK